MMRYLLAILLFSNIASANFKNKVLDMIRSEVSQELISTDFDIQLTNWSDSVERYIEEDAVLSVDDIRMTNNQRNFSVKVSGFKKAPRKFNGKIIWKTHVPVLNVAIAGDDIIARDDVVLTSIDSDRLSGNIVQNINEIVGMTTRGQVIKPGVPINKHQLKAPILVKKGTLVHVTYNQGNLRISTQGIATRDGAKGDTIPFETIHTGLSVNRKNTNKGTIFAKVVNVNTAVVGGNYA